MYTESKIQKIVTNNGMVLEILKMTQYGNHNCALLQRVKDEMLITVRDLTFSKGIECDWCWGHYFQPNHKVEALKDFNEREKEMTSYEI